MPVGTVTHGCDLWMACGSCSQLISEIHRMNHLYDTEHVKQEIKRPLRSNQQRMKCRTTVVFRSQPRINVFLFERRLNSRDVIQIHHVTENRDHGVD